MPIMRSTTINCPNGKFPTALLVALDTEAVWDVLRGHTQFNFYGATVNPIFLNIFTHVALTASATHLYVGNLQPSCDPTENAHFLTLLSSWELSLAVKHLNVAQSAWLFSEKFEWLNRLLKNSTTLTSLNLNACKLGDVGLAKVLDAFTTSKACDRIVQLKISDNGISETGYQMLLDFARIHPSLTACVIDHNGWTAAQCSELENILADNRLFHEKMKTAQAQLSLSASTGSVARLNFSNCRELHARIKHFIRSILLDHWLFNRKPLLIQLDCQSAHMTDAHLKQLLNPLSNTWPALVITGLDLRHNVLTSDSQETLVTSAAQSPLLTHCAIDRSTWTAAALEKLDAALAENQGIVTFLEALASQNPIQIDKLFSDQTVLQVSVRLQDPWILSALYRHFAHTYHFIDQLNQRIGYLLTSACEAGDVDHVRNILLACPNALFYRSQAQNPLEIAILCGHTDLVHYFMNTELWRPHCSYLTLAQKQTGTHAEAVYVQLREKLVNTLQAALQANDEQTVHTILNDEGLHPTHAEWQSWLLLAIHTANRKMIDGLAPLLAVHFQEMRRADLFALDTVEPLSEIQQTVLDQVRLDRLASLCSRAENCEKLAALLALPCVQNIFSRKPTAIMPLVEKAYDCHFAQDDILVTLMIAVPTEQHRIESWILEKRLTAIEAQIEHRSVIHDVFLQGRYGERLLARYGREWLAHAHGDPKKPWTVKPALIEQLERLLHVQDIHTVVSTIQEMDAEYVAKKPHKTVRCVATDLHHHLATSVSHTQTPIEAKMLENQQKRRLQKQSSRPTPAVNLADCRFSFIVSDRPHDAGGAHGRKLITVNLPVDASFFHVESVHTMTKTLGGPRSETLCAEVKTTFPSARHPEINAAFQETNPKAKTAFHRRFHCSERTIYAYLIQESVLNEIIQRVVYQVGDGSLKQLKFYQLIIDMHSTRLLCQDCQASTAFAYHPQSVWVTALVQAIQNAGHAVLTKSRTIGVTTRVSASRKPAASSVVQAGMFNMNANKALRSVTIEYGDADAALSTSALAINLSTASRQKHGMG